MQQNLPPRVIQRIMQRPLRNQRGAVRGKDKVAGKKHTSVAVFVAASFAALSSSTALAGGFALREQSTIGAGMSFAGAGTDSYGLSGMFWNPAAINSATGFEWSSSYSLIVPYGSMRAEPGTFPGLTGSNNSGNEIGRAHV